MMIETEEIDAPPQRIPRIAEIKAEVAKAFKVTVLDLDSDRRAREVAVPRHIAFWIARNRTRHSLPNIGRAFGGRDHTTVIQGMRSLEQKLSKSPELRDQFDAVVQRIDQLAAANSEETINATADA